MALFQPVLPASPAYSEIMEAWQLYGKKLTVQKFYEQHVVTKDPSIKFASWKSFQRRLKEKAKKGGAAPVAVAEQTTPVVPVVNQTYNTNVDPTDLEGNTIEYMMRIGLNALKEIADKPEVAKTIPVKERIRMLSEAMKLQQNREELNLKRNKDNREDSLFQEIMDAAQYGEIPDDDIPEADFFPPEAQQIEAPDEEKKPEEKSQPHVEILSTVTFDPSTLT